jgi:hypothetical protein
MRKAILLAAALALSASVAQAQGRDRDREDDDRRDYRGEERYRDHDDHHGWHRGRGGGARFFMRSGDTRLGVVCDRNESMRNCVDAAITLFDRLRQAAPSGGSPSPSPRP